ncbi:TIGR03083 family protein [Streptomyces sp. DI166]|uniref:maleylpyruvate isomerase family mycothiol-dependent enzyme n=1 Tax=Streptomyces sp. DI166 TaxID=1839783 RepID=UPI0007F3319B|nr:maleylpyruvate isomerase family mycothiol-dependent enzyme [Streptomyces sp. DI166]SBT92004.1 TIGR03083 family protein [Streptomyces sp. DI166]
MTDTWVRDPELPGRLLTVERDALVPVLRARDEADFAAPVRACPGWSVRDVLAHCSAALTRVTEGRFEEGVFSPEANERDIAERAEWPAGRIVDELERGMTESGPVLAKAGGVLDALALGEWVHAGDVREAWGEPEAYAGPGLAYALPLLAAVTRARGHLALQADLDDVDDPLRLGADAGDRTPARFIGDAATLVRLYSGRRPAAPYELAGAEEGELKIFR